MKNKIIFVTFFLIMILIIILAGYFVFYDFKKESFEVDNNLLKTVLKEGESVEDSITIQNIYSDGEFRINSNADFIVIKEPQFILKKGEKKKIFVKFDINNKKPGVYVGELKISKGSEELKIPLILEIETNEVLFDSLINIVPDYSNIYLGGKLILETKIFNLEKIEPENIKVNYAVRDFKGKSFFSESENINVRDEILLTKVISIPKNTEIGKYLFIITIEHDRSIGTNSYPFSITRKKINFENFDIWVFSILILVSIFLILYNLKKRDEIFLGLEKQHREEIQKIVNSIKKKEKNIRSLKKIEKKKKLEEIKGERERKIKFVNKLYHLRVKELKKLKKLKKENDIKEKLKEWKKQGYNIDEFLTKKENFKGNAKKFKTQGYRIS